MGGEPHPAGKAFRTPDLLPLRQGRQNATHFFDHHGKKVPFDRHRKPPPGRGHADDKFNVFSSDIVEGPAEFPPGFAKKPDRSQLVPPSKRGGGHGRGHPPTKHRAGPPGRGAWKKHTQEVSAGFLAGTAPAVRAA